MERWEEEVGIGGERSELGKIDGVYGRGGL